MSQINRPPLGLQNLLGSQNFGDNPSELAQAVAPTLDLLPFYGAGLLRLKRSQGNLNAEGEITSIEFNDPVAFVSLAGWAQGGASPAGVKQLALTISGPPSDSLPVDQQHMLTHDPNGASYVATGQPCCYYTFPVPLVTEPGSTIHLHWIQNPNACNDTVQLTVMYYDLSLP